MWGGGGAFTSVESYKGDLYLSSDVSGVWKQINGNWAPYVNDLTQYNVTALVTFNDLLYAITEDELLYTDGNGGWISTDIKLDTYRSVTDKPFTVSNDQNLMCIASKSYTILCVDKNLNQSILTIKQRVITGVKFAKGMSQVLYYFSSNTLFTIKLKSGVITKIAEFDNKIIALIEQDTRILLATSKNVFDLQNPEKPLYSVYFKNIINMFTVTLDNEMQFFIGLGSKWNIKLHRLVFDNSNFTKGESVDTVYDESLPHRSVHRSLTKFLSINTIDNNTYLTDYWGVFRVSHETKPKLVEISDDAFNIVSTGLIITDNYIYVSTMDNGVIRIDKLPDENNKRHKTAISFSSIRGHAWSMLYFNKTLFAIFAPWNKANDYLFKYSEIDGEKTITKLTNYNNREGRGTYWGESYSRKLVYYHGILSFRDGSNGGLVINKKNTLNVEEPFSFGGFNKVYSAIEEFNGLLYVATCEGPATVIALNQSIDGEFSIKLPKSFCPFTSYKYDDNLYFLGSQNGSAVIYKLVGKKVTKFAEEKVGSAFYSMATNPSNNQQIIIATISWSKKSTSGLFISSNGGQDFVNQSCVLTHNNGVVAIDFDIESQQAYILQKIGGLLTIPLKVIFSQNTCIETE